MSLSEVVSENFKAVALIVGGGAWYASENPSAVPALPDVPAWWPLAAMAIGAAVVGGRYVGAAIYRLLPDPEGIYLVCLDASDDRGGEVWELTPQMFEEMDVAGGALFGWEGSSKRVYECRHYNEETNVAVANWRKSVEASELLGEGEVGDVMNRIAQLRETFEQEARLADKIRRRIPAILRRLDRQRALDQNAALEGHTTPDFGGDSIDEVIADEVPEDALPDYLLEANADEPDAIEADPLAPEDDPMAGIELLDEDEALAPTGSPAAGDDD